MSRQWKKKRSSVSATKRQKDEGSKKQYKRGDVVKRKNRQSGKKPLPVAVQPSNSPPQSCQPSTLPWWVVTPHSMSWNSYPNLPEVVEVNSGKNLPSVQPIALPSVQPTSHNPETYPPNGPSQLRSLGCTSDQNIVNELACDLDGSDSSSDDDDWRFFDAVIEATLNQASYRALGFPEATKDQSDPDVDDAESECLTSVSSSTNTDDSVNQGYRKRFNSSNSSISTEDELLSHGSRNKWEDLYDVIRDDGLNNEEFSAAFPFISSQNESSIISPTRTLSLGLLCENISDNPRSFDAVVGGAPGHQDDHAPVPEVGLDLKQTHGFESSYIPDILEKFPVMINVSDLSAKLDNSECNSDVGSACSKSQSLEQQPSLFEFDFLGHQPDLKTVTPRPESRLKTKKKDNALSATSKCNALYNGMHGMITSSDSIDKLPGDRSFKTDADMIGKNVMNDRDDDGDIMNVDILQKRANDVLMANDAQLIKPDFTPREENQDETSQAKLMRLRAKRGMSQSKQNNSRDDIGGSTLHTFKKTWQRCIGEDILLLTVCLALITFFCVSFTNSTPAPLVRGIDFILKNAYDLEAIIGDVTLPTTMNERQV